MSTSNNEIIISAPKELINNVGEFGLQVTNALNYLQLPTENIFTSIEERIKVFKNIEDVIKLIDIDHRVNSFYISKFIAAVSAGLFDAALNYLWDETISQLRLRVLKHDIQYFFDCAVKTDKRNKLKDASDMDKVDDTELLNGAKEIGLLNNIGFNLLQNIKFMRNWASAAHPNSAEITGIQLISWLETCIREVICLPLTSITVEINKLLENVKSKELTKDDIRNIRVFFANLSEEKVNSLSSGLFGIYTRLDSLETSRKNIIQLIPDLWPRISEEAKNGFGIKYAQYGANGEKEQSKLARSFLQICNAENYIPDDMRASEIDELSKTLLSIHNEMNNFYNEPVIAKQLYTMTKGKIPKQCVDVYVSILIYVFLTNGNGVATSANEYYLLMINNFDQNQAMKSVITITRPEIANKLRYSLCKRKYSELIEIVSKRITQPLFIDLINDIKKAPDYSKVIEDQKIIQKIETVRKII